MLQTHLSLPPKEALNATLNEIWETRPLTVSFLFGGYNVFVLDDVQKYAPSAIPPSKALFYIFFLNSIVLIGVIVN